MAKDSGKTFEEKTLLVIAESANDRGGGTILKVMSWVVDGKEMKPCIEKRDYWQTEDGDKRIGKAKGLTKFDLMEILRHIGKIAPLMEIPAQDLEIAWTMERIGGSQPAPAPAATGAVPAGGPF